MAKRSYTHVTSEIVQNVKELTQKYPTMTSKEMADLTGWCSHATIASIRSGKYDHLIGGKKQERDATKDDKLIREYVDIAYANNALLADIATMLVNLGECQNSHRPTKETEARFRENILANRRVKSIS